MSGGSRDNPERLAALERSGLMDSPPDAALDALVELTRDLLGGTAAFVSLVDDRRQFFTAQSGLGEPWASARQSPLSHSFCQHVVNESGPFVVENARTDARVKDSLAIDEMGVIAYAGVPLVDDFGTGYSSLSYLQRGVFSNLKIDQSFVQQVLESSANAAIVESTIALAKSLNLDVIAEGVETPAHQAWLMAHGCHAFQGYLFGRPMPMEEMEQAVRAQRPLPPGPQSA